jgi:hypothetical protein
MWSILLAASTAIVPEIELQGGLMGGSGTDPTGIALALRAGVDISDAIAISALIIGVPGPAASDSGDYGFFRGADPSGMRAWAALAQFRFHTPGIFQVHLAGALGISRLADWQCNCAETLPLHGRVARMLQASGGFRVVPPSWGGFTVGAQYARQTWNGQQDAIDSAAGFQLSAAPRPMWEVTAVVGYRWH